MRYEGTKYKTPKVPCKGCTKRQIGCHGSCEEYQQGLATWVEEKHQSIVNRAIDSQLRRHQFDQVEKLRRTK